MFHPVVGVKLKLIKIGNRSHTQQFYYYKRRQCFCSFTEPSSGLCLILRSEIATHRATNNNTPIHIILSTSPQ
jgi:hypothetical protein